MKNMPLSKILAKIPVKELEQTLRKFTKPLLELLPDKRLKPQ